MGSCKVQRSLLQADKMDLKGFGDVAGMTEDVVSFQLVTT